MITSTRITITFVLPEDSEQLEAFVRNKDSDWRMTETSSCVSFERETVVHTREKEL